MNRKWQILVIVFFIKVVPNLRIKVDQQYICNSHEIFDPLEKAINIKNILASLLLTKSYQC